MRIIDENPNYTIIVIIQHYEYMYNHYQRIETLETQIETLEAPGTRFLIFFAKTLARLFKKRNRVLNRDSHFLSSTFLLREGGCRKVLGEAPRKLLGKLLGKLPDKAPGMLLRVPAPRRSIYA